MMLINRYIDNPLTIQGSNYFFRYYAFIASSNPFIVFFTSGYLKETLLHEKLLNNNENFQEKRQIKTMNLKSFDDFILKNDP